jgi:hypothetical protein
MEVALVLMQVVLVVLEAVPVLVQVALVMAKVGSIVAQAARVEALFGTVVPQVALVLPVDVVAHVGRHALADRTIRHTGSSSKE